jgi:hypothetical protein
MLKHVRTASAALLCTFVVTLATAQAQDPVLDWNRTAAVATVSPSAALAPVRQTRVMAIIQVAVHDAVNSITGKFALYGTHGAAPAGASPEAAAIAAAHTAAVALIPSQTAFLNDQYALSLLLYGIASADPGLTFGAGVANDILQLRQNDGAAQAQFAYVPPNAGELGVWTPLGTQVALLAGWGKVTTFVLRAGSQFRPDAPPALDSGRYARDYNEIIEIGRNTSTVRTEEQTNIAHFWRASPVDLWNPVLQQALIGRGFDMSASARTMALVYMAASDSSVACWDAKYFYNFWRPLPAIMNGNIDGNPATIGDTTWAPLLPTPAHPEYPSGHSTNSSAIAMVLALVFGDDPGVPIVATSSTALGFVRNWTRFSEGVEEVIDARVYSGIHFRTADVVGARLGRQVARFVVNHALKPIKNE